MNYLKSAEMAAYAPRVSVPSGQEQIHSLIASRLVDAYCQRTLSIQHYLSNFDCNRSIVGYLPVIPIVAIDPQTLTTGLQLRPLAKTWAGQREEIGIWLDINIPGLTVQPNGQVAAGQLSDILNVKTGRLEIITWLFTDYNRLFYGRALSDSRHAQAWLANCEYQAGFYVDTTLTAVANNNDTTLKLASVLGLVANQTYLTIGDTAVGQTVQRYLVTAVDATNKIATISPAVTGGSPSYAIGTSVTQDPDLEVKVATGMVIEDRLTFEPNTTHQLETLDVLSTRLVRAGKTEMPLDAQRMLARFRNRFGVV